MACLNFRNTYFRKHLLMATFIRFRSTCFSEHLNVDDLFIKQPSYFLLGIFLFKESPKKNTYLHSHFHEERAFHHCFSSCFYHFFLHCHSSKTFLYWRNIKILIPLSDTFNVKHYIHKTYLNKKLIWVYIRITKLQYSKQKLSREVNWTTWFWITVYTG